MENRLRKYNKEVGIGKRIKPRTFIFSQGSQSSQTKIRGI
jgi:hypothetical protein